MLPPSAEHFTSLKRFVLLLESVSTWTNEGPYKNLNSVLVIWKKNASVRWPEDSFPFSMMYIRAAGKNLNNSL